MDLRMALFSRSIELPEHAPRVIASATGGACYRRRNEDTGASFRNRDNARRRNWGLDVKSLFNRLNPRPEKLSP
jgi:hypothetical protein